MMKAISILGVALTVGAQDTQVVAAANVLPQAGFGTVGFGNVGNFGGFGNVGNFGGFGNVGNFGGFVGGAIPYATAAPVVGAVAAAPVQQWAAAPIQQPVVQQWAAPVQTQVVDVPVPVPYAVEQVSSRYVPQIVNQERQVYVRGDAVNVPVQVARPVPVEREVTVVVPQYNQVVTDVAVYVDRPVPYAVQQPVARPVPIE